MPTLLPPNLYWHLVLATEADGMNPDGMLYFLQVFLPAATKLGQYNVFTGVCDSVNRGGCLSKCMLGYSRPRADTPKGRHSPKSRHPPPSRHPPRPGTPPMGPGSPHQDQVHPQTRYTPGTRYIPPWPGTPPGTKYTPQDQVHPSRPPTPPCPPNMANQQLVRILLECILVSCMNTERGSLSMGVSLLGRPPRK